MNKAFAKKSKWRVNGAIGAATLRVIDTTGKQVGVISKDEALSKAKELGVDLIEIAPKANPPVAKLIEFGKFLYQEEKKAKKEKRGAKGGELKEVRLSPFIAQGDFDNRFGKIKGFLGESNKVRVVVKFKGRQMGSKKFGYQLLTKILDELGDSVVIDMKPKFLGRHLAMVISPLKKGKADLSTSKEGSLEENKNGKESKTKVEKTVNQTV